MGKYKKGILGYFRGKIGTVIGSIWKGINYMKSLPDLSENDPSPAQLIVRLKFAIVADFLSHIKGLINIGYQKFNQGMTPMNAATSYHLKFAISGVAPDFQILYNKVIISVGDLEDLPNIGVTAAPGSELVFSWGANQGMEYGENTDMLSFLVYCPTLFKYVRIVKVVPRSALTYTLSLPAEFGGTTVQCWLMATNAAGKECSTSQYLGALPVM